MRYKLESEKELKDIWCRCILYSKTPLPGIREGIESNHLPATSTISATTGIREGIERNNHIISHEIKNVRPPGIREGIESIQKAPTYRYRVLILESEKELKVDRRERSR